MSELVPWSHYDSVSLRRSTARQLDRIDEQSLVSRATIQAREQDAAFRAQLRIDNGYRLAAQTISNATHLNQFVTQVSQGNPGLEMTLRGIEQGVAMAAQSVVYQYMAR
jgi:hypothetical protein